MGGCPRSQVKHGSGGSWCLTEAWSHGHGSFSNRPPHCRHWSWLANKRLKTKWKWRILPEWWRWLFVCVWSPVIEMLSSVWSLWLTPVGVSKQWAVVWKYPDIVSQLVGSITPANQLLGYCSPSARCISRESVVYLCPRVGLGTVLLCRFSFWKLAVVL